MRFDKSGKLLGFIEGKEEAQGRSGGPDICKKIIFRHTLN